MEAHDPTRGGARPNRAAAAMLDDTVVGHPTVVGDLSGVLVREPDGEVRKWKRSVNGSRVGADDLPARVDPTGATNLDEVGSEPLLLK